MKYTLLLCCLVLCVFSCTSSSVKGLRKDTITTAKGSGTEEKPELILLNKVRVAIKQKKNRDGYMALQEFERLYMTDEIWLSIEKPDYEQFKTKEQILESAIEASQNGKYGEAYLLYKLILPDLR